MNDNRIRFRYIINYFLPALLTIALYVILLLVFILPYFEAQLFERKRELIRELTLQAINITNELKNEADSGTINIDEAILHLKYVCKAPVQLFNKQYKFDEQLLKKIREKILNLGFKNENEDNEEIDELITKYESFKIEVQSKRRY